MTLISLFKQTNPKNANLLIQGPDSFFNDYLFERARESVVGRDRG